MLNIGNFKSYNIEKDGGRAPLLCVSVSSIIFGKGAIKALGGPSYAKILFDDEHKLMLLIPCEESDPDAFDFVGGYATNKLYVRIKSSALRAKLNSLTGLDPEVAPYRVQGTFEPEVKGLCFDLSKAYVPGKTTTIN